MKRILKALACCVAMMLILSLCTSAMALEDVSVHVGRSEVLDYYLTGGPIGSVISSDNSIVTASVVGRGIKVSDDIYYTFDVSYNGVSAGSATVNFYNNSGWYVGSVTVYVVDHTWDKGTTNIEATCTTEGTEVYMCSACQKTKTQVIPAKGHDDGEWIVAKAATCKDDGLKELHCKACDAVLDTEVIAAAGVEHKPTDWVVTKEADCENDGSKQKTCTVCNAVLETEVIKALGHKAGEWAEVKAPTCTEEGEKEQKCTVCNTLLKSEAVAALGHKAGEWAEVKAPTCIKEGAKEQKCTVCAVVLAEDVIPAKGHVDGEWVVTKKPTRLEEGEKQLPCAACGAVLAKESIPVLTVIDYSMTACSVGPRFRDVGVATGEWDMFTPVDLSADGEWQYDLIAGNTHVIGNVTVKVAGGKVTVDYVLNSKQMKVNSEFVTFLPSIGDVTTIKHEELKVYAFGQEIDIAEELGGDTKVLLYVCNRILYDSDTNGVEHFSRDSVSYNALCEELAQIMD